MDSEDPFQAGNNMLNLANHEEESLEAKKVRNLNHLFCAVTETMRRNLDRQSF